MSSTDDQGANATRAVVLDRVTKAYGDAAPVLAGLSLTFGAGQFVSVIGPSGCGKSTMLRLVAGLDEPDVGEISLFGVPPAEARRTAAVGYVPQSLALLPWRSVLDNVRLPLEVGARAGHAPRDPVELLRSFGLGEVVHRMPSELSGGMRQRVALARALVGAPALLLLDEPFSSLDELTRERLRRELLEAWQAAPTTVIFVTHSVTEAVVLSDAVVVLASPPSRAPVVIPVDLPRPRPELVELSEPFISIEREVRLALCG